MAAAVPEESLPIASLAASRCWREAVSSLVHSTVDLAILVAIDSSRSLSEARRVSSSFSSSSLSPSATATSRACNSATRSWSLCGSCSAWRRFFCTRSEISCSPLAAMLICSAEEVTVRARASSSRCRSSSASFFWRSKRAISGTSAMRAPPKMHAKIVNTAAVESGRSLFIATNPAVPRSTASLRKKIHMGSFGLGSGEFMRGLAGRPRGKGGSRRPARELAGAGKRRRSAGGKFVRGPATGLKAFAARRGIADSGLCR